MMLTLLGSVFQAVGRVRGGDAGADLARVGAELRRLERPAAQAPATSR
ncbi:MAG TPA: hypothetical protein VMI55_02320 [Thermoplasmata archaeon]|nr:hypothetical protein [Thermoplasmata archaeon]